MWLESWKGDSLWKQAWLLTQCKWRTKRWWRLAGGPRLESRLPAPASGSQSALPCLPWRWQWRCLPSPQHPWRVVQGLCRGQLEGKSPQSCVWGHPRWAKGGRTLGSGGEAACALQGSEQAALRERSAKGRRAGQGQEQREGADSRQAGSDKRGQGGGGRDQGAAEKRGTTMSKKTKAKGSTRLAKQGCIQPDPRRGQSSRGQLCGKGK